MTTPRRYRAALLAYPRGYRTTRGPELLATLADGDDERGHPSSREAVALAQRGLQMRGRLAVEPEGLLVAAAALVLVALLGDFTWATHVFMEDGEPGAMLLEGGPGRWWALALAVTAFTVIAAGPFQAADTERRRRAAALLAIVCALNPLGLLPFMLDFGVLTAAGAVVSDWETWQYCLAMAAGTWAVLRVVARLSPGARLRALGTALFSLSAAAIYQTWDRPATPFEYEQSAFADLGPPPFIIAAGLLLMLFALARAAARILPQR